MKVAFSHDWLNGMRGGEKCLEALCEIYPGSPVYTLFYEKGKVSAPIADHPIRTSFLQKFPKIFSRYRIYLPFYPWAERSLAVRDCDVLVSLTHCAAKAVSKPPRAVHVCYCFTPMRYAWGFFDDYFGDYPFFLKMAVKGLLALMRKWDLKINRGVAHFVAISQHIRDRIRHCYGREAEVIYPPVDTDFYTPAEEFTLCADRENAFFLVVSALVPYKKVDLAVRVLSRSKKRLVVIGDGPLRQKLEAMGGPNVRFLGWQPNEVLRDHYRKAIALLFPGQEDFGIVPVEAQACGCPVIAYGAGGALETVLDGKTGVFFDRQTEQCLAEAIDRFEWGRFDAADARKNALRFAKARFQSEMKALIEHWALRGASPT